jgi:hypothetical protein
MGLLGEAFRKRAVQNKEKKANERELLNAEAAAASPWGTPTKSGKKRRAGEAYTPARGDVSEDAYALANDKKARAGAKTLLNQENNATQDAIKGKGFMARNRIKKVDDRDADLFQRETPAEKEKRNRSKKTTHLGGSSGKLGV